MKKSRLINIFFTLTKKEIRLLRKWLESPFHNQRTDVIDLFNYLIKNDHFKKDKYIQKERVFTVLYPKETYDDAKMRQVMYFLLKTIEGFFIYQELLKDEVNAKITLASVYRKRMLNSAFENAMNTAKKAHENYSYRNESFNINNYKLEKEQYFYFEMNPKRNIPLNLQQVSDTFDIFYLSNKLRQSCLMLAHQKVYKAEYSIGMIENIIKYAEQKKYIETIPAISIYYYGFKLSQGEDLYEKLKKEIIENTDLFPLEEIRDIYLMAINYCIGKMNIGIEQYVREAFEMFQLGFQKGILAQKDDLFRWTFLNVVMIAIRLKEYFWAENFIFDFQEYITKRYREGFINYTLARLNFEKKNYPLAIEHLNKSEYDDIVISLTAKAMLLKIYYEQGEIDLLDALLESTRTYMQRKKVMGYHKTAFRSLLKYTKKLVRVNPYSREEKDKLREEINAANPLTEKAWLLEQLDKM